MKHITYFIVVVWVGIVTACTTNIYQQQYATSFPSDSVFLNYIQEKHFQYMWTGAEANSGLACERIHIDGDYPENDQHIVTTGGSGFGIAGLVVGMERKFITRQQGVERMTEILDFLERADRYYGVWSHWIDGKTGKTKPFGKKDNGGDLVESAFLMQGLICVREYFKNGTEQEKQIAQRIDKLWREMNWQWYQNGKDVLYWHWSPDYGWEMNFPLEGYNECLITYILAAASPTYPVAAPAYYKGWLRNNTIHSSNTAYGYPLLIKHNYAEDKGGPLFWAHYSYIGFNPKNLKDSVGTDYWGINVNHAKIQHAYCKENPLKHAAYSDSCWGLTSSYSMKGYAGHAPGRNDLGVISPTAALSSFPYTPEESMKALRYFYFTLGEKIWGKYGFYDAFSVQDSWYPQQYLAIDQCTIAPMIENYRTGLLWNLFMNAPEVKQGLERLMINYQ